MRPTAPRRHAPTIAEFAYAIPEDSTVDDFLPVFNIVAYGARVDGKQLADSIIDAASAVLHNASAPYTPGDAGKPIFIQGAGPSADSYYGLIAEYFSPTQVRVSPAATTSVVNARTIYGTDDSAAIQAAIDAAAVHGGTVFHPAGLAICNATLTLPSLVRYMGANDASQLAYIGGASDHTWVQVNTASAGFSVDGVLFNYTGCDDRSTTIISITDSVYFTLRNIFVQGSVQTNRCVGILLHAVSPSVVPPPGFARITNYVYSSGDGDFPSTFTAVGAIALQVLAEPGSLDWSFVFFDGYGDLEAATVCVSATRMYSSNMTGWYLSGTEVGLQLVACQNNFFRHVHTANSTPQITIDSACFDNLFDMPAFTNPHTWATCVVDAGVRTIWRGTGNYQVSPVPYGSSSTAQRPNPIPETVAAYMEWDTTLQAPIWGLGGTTTWYNTTTLPLAGFFYGPLTFSGGQVLIAPTSATLVTMHVPQNILPAAAPPAPAAGMTLYVDQADGQLKAISSTGAIKVIAP